MALSFQPSMKARISVLRSLTEPNVPRWMACFSMMPNQTSTRFSQEPEVGVKCTWILGLAAPARTAKARVNLASPRGTTSPRRASQGRRGWVRRRALGPAEADRAAG